MSFGLSDFLECVGRDQGRVSYFDNFSEREIIFMTFEDIHRSLPILLSLKAFLKSSTQNLLPQHSRGHSKSSRNPETKWNSDRKILFSASFPFRLSHFRTELNQISSLYKKLAKSLREWSFSLTCTSQRARNLIRERRRSLPNKNLSHKIPLKQAREDGNFTRFESQNCK